MDRIHSDAQMHSRDGEVESHIRMRAGTGASGGWADQSGRLRDFGERAGEFAERLRDGVQDGFDRVGSALGRRSEAVEAIRKNPLAAVGISFLAGAALAVATASDSPNWVVERARRRLRGLIVSGATALLVQELRSVVGAQEGFGDLVQSFLEGDEEFDFDEEDA